MCAVVSDVFDEHSSYDVPREVHEAALAVGVPNVALHHAVHSEVGHALVLGRSIGLHTTWTANERSSEK